MESWLIASPYPGMILWFITFSPFFFGGVLVCVVNGLRHSRYAGQASSAKPKEKNANPAS